MSPNEDRRAPRDAVVREALSWIGTPYRHQGCQKNVACDCLGLVRGVWRALYGLELEDPGPYAPDWSDEGRAEPLLEGCGRHLTEKPVVEMLPGDLLLFRWRPRLAVKHAGILIHPASFIHAYEAGGGVTRSSLVPQWKRRIAAVFAFPPLSST